MSAPVSMSAVKRRLAVVWLAGSGLLCVLVVVQSVRGVYDSDTDKAWAWLLPSFMPTLSLIVGVVVADGQQQDRADLAIDPFLPRLTYIFSAVYLVAVAATIFLQPISSASPLALMNMSHFWLAPLQGLVSAVMGAFFVRQEAKK